MALRKIVEMGDDCLTKVCRPVTEFNSHLHEWVPGCLELSGTGNPAGLDAFRQGKFLVQDGAARLVSCIANPRPGDRVLDVCAAPGGKSFSAAFAMEDHGHRL